MCLRTSQRVFLRNYFGAVSPSGVTGGHRDSAGLTISPDRITSERVKRVITYHRLKLPTYLQATSFEQFMLTRYIPALRAEAGRAGAFADIKLLRRQRESEDDTPGVGREFLFALNHGDAPRECPPDFPLVRDPTISGVYGAFGVLVEQLGLFDATGSTGERP